MEPIIQEVREAVFRAHPEKAPEHDKLPAIVWQKLWPVVGNYIVGLFNVSI